VHLLTVGGSKSLSEHGQKDNVEGLRRQSLGEIVGAPCPRGKA